MPHLPMSDVRYLSESRYMLDVVVRRVVRVVRGLMAGSHVRECNRLADRPFPGPLPWYPCPDTPNPLFRDLPFLLSLVTGSNKIPRVFLSPVNRCVSLQLSFDTYI